MLMYLYIYIYICIRFIVIKNLIKHIYVCFLFGASKKRHLKVVLGGIESLGFARFASLQSND